MKGFREEVLVVGTKFAILFGVVCILFLTLPMLLMNQFLWFGLLPVHIPGEYKLLFTAR
ncbi:hypothetical protein sp82g_171 [Bacillus phage SP82G]|nr:hypothetical protein sp82g_171 [Bacillus phage SP82G]